MATTAPGLHAVEPSTTRQVVRRNRRHEPDVDDDPTEYPSSEVMCREPIESYLAGQLEPVLARLLASRGVQAYVGSDNFIYYRKGDNKACVSPDLYTLPGVPQTLRPRHLLGSKDEGCWKTWLLGVKPNFALEIKAFRNPRKDELQSPQRHDHLGTKELIVFDPFADRRRQGRKRFALYRRNDQGRLVMVLDTNEDRVYSEELDGYIIAEGKGGDDTLLRIGLGANGAQRLPLESELVQIQTQRADEQARLRQEEARLRQEEARLRQEEARLRQEETQRADEATRRTAQLEMELARLRAQLSGEQDTKRPAKRNKSSDK